SPTPTGTPATIAPTQPAPTAGPTIIFGVSALAAQFCGAATHSVVEGLPKPPAPAELPPVKLSLRTDPSKAALFVNGVRRGTTPLELELAPEQTVEVKLERDGYLSHQQSVSASDAPELVIKLKREKRGSSTKKPTPGLAIID
ncbi:MAG: PEGA domain-containing protein, partial [Myxococcota bacterium]|nr:PEGA domain-containing protein [Myxococcota bacterium]